MHWLYVATTWVLAQVFRLREYLRAVPSVPHPPSSGGGVSYGHLNENAIWVFQHPNRPGNPVYHDPWAVSRKLRELDPKNAWVEALTVLEAVANADAMPGAESLLASAHDQAEGAFADLAALAMKVFDLPSVAQAGKDGWTDGMAFILLVAFLGACRQVGMEFLPLPKPPARPAVSVRPTDGSFSGSGSTEAVCAINGSKN